MKVSSVFEVVRCHRLIWFEYAENKSDDDWVQICQQLLVEGKAGRERGRKTWLECVRKDEGAGTQGRCCQTHRFGKLEIFVKSLNRASMKNRRITMMMLK